MTKAHNKITKNKKKKKNLIQNMNLFYDSIIYK